jgi:hypothetical protein
LLDAFFADSKDMDADLLARLSSDLFGRLDGPLSFRFVLQPLMAVIYAARDGIVDARKGRPPYFWSLLTSGDGRWDLLYEGEKAVARVIVLGVVMEVIYQLMVFRWIYPFELIVVVLVLAFVPYLLLRGPINRIARHFIQPRQSGFRARS